LDRQRQRRPPPCGHRLSCAATPEPSRPALGGDIGTYPAARRRRAGKLAKSKGYRAAQPYRTGFGILIATSWSAAASAEDGIASRKMAAGSRSLFLGRLLFTLISR